MLRSTILLGSFLLLPSFDGVGADNGRPGERKLFAAENNNDDDRWIPEVQRIPKPKVISIIIHRQDLARLIGALSLLFT